MDALTKKLVFVIDDDTIHLRFLESHFALLGGFEVMTFPSGKSAMEKIDLKPDLVIIDHNLNEPGKTGLDYLREIKKKSRDSMIIYISGEASPEVIQEARLRGASEYITKNEGTLVRLRVIIDWISGQPNRKGFFGKWLRGKPYLSLTYH